MNSRKREFDTPDPLQSTMSPQQKKKKRQDQAEQPGQDRQGPREKTCTRPARNFEPQDGKQLLQTHQRNCGDRRIVI
jgi:hypothetical protein